MSTSSNIMIETTIYTIINITATMAEYTMNTTTIRMNMSHQHQFSHVYQPMSTTMRMVKTWT